MQRVLADALRVTPRNVTGLVDGLVAAGLVRREPHPTDRRATMVSLTPGGVRLTDELARGHEELAAVLFGGLPDDELQAFVATSTTVLARLAERLPAGAVGADAVAVDARTAE